MCMGGSPPAPPPPPPPADATKALTTPEQGSASVAGQRTSGSSRGGLRVDIGGGNAGSGLNIPVS